MCLVPIWQLGSQGGSVLADIRTPPLYFALKVVAGDLTPDEHRLAGFKSNIAKATSAFIPLAGRVRTPALEAGWNPSGLPVPLVARQRSRRDAGAYWIKGRMWNSVEAEAELDVCAASVQHHAIRLRLASAKYCGQH